jgi:hypothetical protein
MKPSRSHKPRLVVLRVALVLAMVQLVFAAVVYVVALVLAWRSGEPGPTAMGALLGIICALVALLFITVFHLRRETAVVPLEDRVAFLRRLGGQLEELGYAVSMPEENRLVGTPAFHALLFGGRLEARIGNERAILSGPRVYLEVLRQRLRLHAHLEQVPHALSMQRQRHGEPMLREVRIKVQVPGELLPTVYGEVAAVLAHEGADINCELCIQGMAENGLRAHILETKVRAWLTEQQIPVEMEMEPLVSAGDLTGKPVAASA